MARKSLIYLIYKDLTKAVSGIGQKTFLERRPKVSSEELSDFIVVDIPTEIRGMVKGSVDFMADCYGTFSVFCKAKADSTINIVAQTKLVQEVLDLFPINDKHIVATNPRILLQGEDGYGYHVTKITFSLRTKLNARDM